MPHAFNMQICNEYEKMDPEARSVFTYLSMNVNNFTDVNGIKSTLSQHF